MERIEPAGDCGTVRVRPEAAADQAAIRAVNRAAFETDEESRLVDLLRERAVPFLSLVAQSGAEVAGHIAFSPVTLPGREDFLLMGLAPMAVRPRFQRQGIGTLLVRAGLDECRQRGVCAVVVLGDPAYYGRFGFVPSTRFGIRSDYEAPEDVFRVLELQEGSLRDATGTVHYHEEFRSLGG